MAEVNDSRSAAADGSARSALEREVHVWLAATADVHEEQLAAPLALLDAAERARAAAFRFPRDRILYVVAHALVRTTLSRYAPVAPSAWSFRTNAYGRPEIATPGAPAGLRFNLSHTRGLAACVIHGALDVGVDVEEMRPTADLMELAHYSFAEAEVDVLRGAGTPEQLRASFYRFWTLKEAYIKARGMGLSIPTRRFALTPAPDGSATVEFDAQLQDEPRHWQFFHGRASETHALAVAIRRGDGADHTIVQRWIDVSAAGAPPSE